MRITEGVDPLNFEFGTNRQGVLDYPLEGGRDTDPAPTLTIDDTNGIVLGQLTVMERGLRSASDADTSETASGFLTLTTPGGLIELTIGGSTFTPAQLAGGGLTVNTGTGILTLTGFNPATGRLDYSYTLNAAVNQPGADSSTDILAVTVRSPGGVASGNLVVNIVDDVPEAKDDAPATPLTEDSGSYALSGNVFDNDEPGADVRANPVTPVTVTLPHGTLVLNVDGSYTYTLDNAKAQYLAAGESKTDTYTYTITDADGDTSTAVLSIRIEGTGLGVSLLPDTGTGPETAVLTGNVLTDDIAASDSDMTLSVFSFSYQGEHGPTTATPGATGVQVYDGSNWIGTLTLATSGAYSFTPRESNFSGKVPEIGYTVQNSVGQTLGSSTLNLSVTPVADQAKLTPFSGTGDEDTAIALNLKLPEITDKTDFSASAGDWPERLGPIALSLRSLSNDQLPDYTNFKGTQLVDGQTGNVLFTFSDHDVHIRISGAGDAYHVANSFPTDLELTKAQFENLKILPISQSGSNIRVQLSVNEFEVDASGMAPVYPTGHAYAGQLVWGDDANYPGGTWSGIYQTIDVKAVTDGFDLQIKENNTSSNWLDVGDGTTSNSTDVASFTTTEDTTFNLKTLLKTAANFADTDGSEMRWITIENPSGNSTIRVNGTDVAGGGSIRINATRLNVATLAEAFGDINITGGKDLSGDFNGIKVTLHAQDRDYDSNGGTASSPANATVLSDTVTFNLHVTPEAGDVAISPVTTKEDTPVNFMSAFRLTDTDGSEAVTSLTIKGIPTGWVLKNGASTLFAATDSVQEFTVTGMPPAGLKGSDLTTFFQNYTLTPPAHSSRDAQITLTVETKDSLGSTDNTVTKNLTQTIAVTPVAEHFEREGASWKTTDSDGNNSPDLTMTAGKDYDTRGKEDTAFDLNQDGFVFSDGWLNQDGNETVYAGLTPYSLTDGASGDSLLGAKFTWTEGVNTVTRTWDGATPIDVPSTAFDTIKFIPPKDVAGSFTIKVAAVTVDYDDDAPDNAAKANTQVSGEATLTFVIDPVADQVTLAVQSAVVKEDQPVALRINPITSDASETMTVKISGIPGGATLNYGGANQTLTLEGDGTYSLTISDFSKTTQLLLTPPANSNQDITLKVESWSVETNGGASSVPVSAQLQVDVHGVADTVSVTTADLTPTTEGALDSGAGSHRVSLSGAITEFDTGVDADGSETHALLVKGVPAGVHIEGMQFVGGSGSERIWSATNLAAFNNAQLVFENNWSGTLKLQISAVSTENDGDTYQSRWQEVKLEVAPTPEATIVTSTALVEDGPLTRVDFTLQPQNGDTNETLAGVRISASSLESNHYRLYLDAAGTQEITKLTSNAGYYELDATQAQNLYARGVNNYSGAAGFSFQYGVTDKSVDGTLSNTVWTTATYGLAVSGGITPLSDATATTLVSAPVGTTAAGHTATITVNVTQLDDTDGPDIDGSEQLTHFVIDNVPSGVVVVGGVCLGSTGSGWRWMLDIADKPFKNTATLAQDIQFDVIHSAASQNSTLTITAFSRDTGALLAASSSTDWTFSTTGAGGGGGDGSSFAKVTQWADKSGTLTEDSAQSLSALVDAEISNANVNTQWSITLIDLPNGCTVTGSGLTITQMTHGNQNLWVVSGSGDNDALQTALDNITITPPLNWNDNKHTDLPFKSTLTLFDMNANYATREAVEFHPTVTPVSDSTTISLTDQDIGDAANASSTITIRLSNPADDSAAQVVDGQVYLRLNEEAGMNGTLSYNGIPLVKKMVNGITGLLDGEYYVITGVASATETLSLSYQPGANTRGTVSYDVYVQNQETGASNVVLASQYGSFTVSPANNGVTFGTLAASSGDEDKLVQLNVSATLNDSAHETIHAVRLENVPAEFLVFVGDAPSQTAALNLGDGVWGLPLTAGATAIPKIWIKGPEHWSGKLEDMTLKLWSGEAGIEPTLSEISNLALDILPVADGLVMHPNYSFGKENAPVELNLNSYLADKEERVTLKVEGLGEKASFFGADGAALTAVWDGSVYTLSNLTEADVIALSVLQWDGDYHLKVTAQTTDQADGLAGSTSSPTSATFDLHIANVPGSAGDDRLLYNGDRVDGGDGQDTVLLRPDDNLTGADLGKLFNVEVIDLSGGAHQVAGLSQAAVLGMTGAGQTLTVQGDADDSVSLVGGWSSTDGVTYTSGTATFVNAGGGAKVAIEGTGGADTLHYSGHETQVDGGVGTDTLMLVGDTLGLGDADFSKLKGIERIDLTQGDHTITGLDPKDVLDISGDSKQLMILGDTNDSVQLAKVNGVGFTMASGANATETIGGHTFDVYTSAYNISLKLLIENTIQVDNN